MFSLSFPLAALPTGGEAALLLLFTLLLVAGAVVFLRQMEMHDAALRLQQELGERAAETLRAVQAGGDRTLRLLEEAWRSGARQQEEFRRELLGDLREPPTRAPVPAQPPAAPEPVPPPVSVPVAEPVSPPADGAGGRRPAEAGINLARRREPRCTLLVVNGRHSLRLAGELADGDEGPLQRAGAALLEELRRGGGWEVRIDGSALTGPGEVRRALMAQLVAEAERLGIGVSQEPSARPLGGREAAARATHGNGQRR